jgi:hypothetical protein
MRVLKDIVGVGAAPGTASAKPPEPERGASGGGGSPTLNPSPTA